MGNPNQTVQQQTSSGKGRLILIAMIPLFLLFSGVIYTSIRFFGPPITSQEQKDTSETSGVLANNADNADLAGQVNFNIPAIFNEDVTINADLLVKGATTLEQQLTVNADIIADGHDLNLGTGEITASNVVYGITAGDNITITGDPQNPTISTEDGVSSVNGQTGALTLVAGDGIAIDGLTITNDDRGSAQNIFKNITAGGSSFSAGSNTDTITFQAGSGISISTGGSNTITIANTQESSGGGISTVSESNTAIVTSATILNFLDGDFDISQSPSGQANVTLASTLSSVTGVAGSFTTGSDVTVGNDLILGGDTVSDITGSGLTITSSALGINLTTTGGTGATTSNSGLEVGSDGLTLLKGCSNDQILAWSDSGEAWQCMNQSGGGGGITTIKNNGVTIGTTFDTLDFSSLFTVTESPANEGNVTIAANSLNFTEFSNALALDAATTITNALTGNLTIDLTSTGDFVIADNGTAAFTFTDTGGLTQNGTGQVIFTGNVDATSGLDVTGANLTVGGTNATITTAGVITGTTINATTGINTGAGAGTQRIDASGNLVNINNITADGTITFSGLSTGIVKSSGAGVLSSSAVNLASADVTGILPIANGGTNTSTIGTAGAVAYSTGTTYNFSAAGSTGQCLVSGGTGTPTWGTCDGASAGYWNQANGALYAGNTTVDLLIGGISSASAKFAVLNVAGGTPTASVSGTTGASSLTADGNLATTNNQNLTLGGATTGNITLNPLGGTGTVNSTGNMNLAINKEYLINNASVLSATTLGSSVVNSSLTSVGALNSGSITTGFSTILTANTIQGSDITASGTTGFTGSGAGAGLTFSGTGTHNISASSGTLQLGAATLGGTILGNGQSLTGLGALSATGDVNFSPTLTNDISLVTDTDSTLNIAGLQSGTGNALCVDGSSNVITCTVGSGGVSGSGTAGQITYFNGTSSVTSEASGFAWDATNNRLGLGTDTPDGKLHVTGANVGKALAIFNETGDQNILTASASGATRFSVDRSGNIISATGAKWMPTANSASALNIAQADGTAFVTFDTSSTKVGIGTSTPTSKLHVQTSSPGKAAVTFNYTGTDQNILTASTSGVAVANLDFAGNLAIEGQLSDLTGTTLTVNDNLNLTTGNAYQIAGTNVLTNDTLGTGIVNSSLTSVGTLTTGTWNATVIGTAYGGLGANVTAAGGGEILYSTGTTTYGHLAAGAAGQCLTSGGTGAPAWSTCAAGANNYWNQANGALYAGNTTVDLLIGGISSASAKFAVLNIAGGTPTASLSGTTGGAYLTADGKLATTNKQSLVLGDSNTGNLDVYNNKRMNFFTDAGTTLRGYVGQEPSSNDLSLISKTSGAWLRLGSTGLGGIGFWTDGNADVNTSPQMFLNSAGQLGIGALLPSALLDVNGTASVSGAFKLYGTTPSIQSTTNKTLTIGGDTTGNISLAPRNGAGTVFITGTNGLDLTGASAPLAFSGSGTHTISSTGQLNINSTGNIIMNPTSGVGIGTSSVAYKLTVSQSTASDVMRIENTNASGFASINYLNNASTGFFTGLGGSSTFLSNLYYIAATGANELATLTMNTSGNVGLGTYTALAKLDVRGGTANQPAASISANTRAAAMIVDNSNGGDIFTASASGLPRFTIQNDGTIVLGADNTATQADIIFRGASTSAAITGANMYFDAQNAGSGSGDLIFRTTGASGETNTVTLDANTGNHNTTGATSLSWSHVTGSQDSRLLIVSVSGSSSVTFSATYGGVAMTSLDSQNCGGAAGCKAHMFYMKDPPAGSATVQVNATGSTDIAASSQTYYNVDQTDTFGTVAKNSGTATPDSVTVTTDATQLVIDAFSYIAGSGASTPGAGQTELWDDATHTGGAGSYKTGEAGTTSMSWTPATTTDDWALIGVGLNPTVATGGQMTDRVHITGDGNVGIGNSDPQFKLDVIDGQSATAAAMIWNNASNNAVGHTGLIVKLGTAGSSTNPNANDAFINFLQGNGRRRGQIIGNGSTGVTYQTGGADYGEYFQKADSNEEFDLGDVVCFAKDSEGVTKCADGNNNVLGVISDNSGFVGGASEDQEDHPERYVTVGLLGQISTKVSSANGPIKPGDVLAIDYTGKVGVAGKATQTGKIIGRALQGFSNADSDAVEKIKVYVSQGWHDPGVNITDTGNVNIFKDPNNPDDFKITDKDGTVITRADIFSEVKIANITAGVIDVQKLMVDGKNIMDIINGTKNETKTNNTDLHSVNSQITALQSTQDQHTKTLDSLQARVASLSSLMNMNNKVSPFDASSAAEMGLDKIDASTIAVSDTLQVFGKTTLNDLGVAGNITAGLISINGLEGEINTAADTLKLQSTGLNGVDILDGKVTIAKDGNIQTKGDITAKKYNVSTKDVAGASLGEATLPAGKVKIDIETSAVTSESAIFLTPKTKTSEPLSVTQQTPKGSFTVEVEQPSNKDILFNWWIVN